MVRQPHILAVPYPAQGHVAPFLKLSYHIAGHGIKVTFVNIKYIHGNVIAAMSEKGLEQKGITLASIPDGLECDNEHKKAVKSQEQMQRVMPGHLIVLIEKINHSDHDESITCILADVTIGWILEVAKIMGVEQAAFCPFSASCLVLASNIPKLVEAGIIDSNGSVTKDEKIWLSKDMPPWSNNELTWSSPNDLKAQKSFFECAVAVSKTVEQANWLLCNTFYQLDSPAFDLVPKILPIGPLLHTSMDENYSAYSGNFWLEDASCLSWLDRQQPSSVIYVAFGSTAIISQQQFNELALGLELAARPFLWVIRADLTNGSPAVHPDGFLEKVANRGKIVEWAPQERVLSHPAAACFLSHCGWNSTLEGVSLGVPFLCWPYFTDQFQNQNYICDVWKVGLKLNPDENGIRSRHEIASKILILLSDGNIKENSLKLKDLGEKNISKGGSSFENLNKFINHLKNITSSSWVPA